MLKEKGFKPQVYAQPLTEQRIENAFKAKVFKIFNIGSGKFLYPKCAQTQCDANIIETPSRKLMITGKGPHLIMNRFSCRRKAQHFPQGMLAVCLNNGSRGF